MPKIFSLLLVLVSVGWSRRAPAESIHERHLRILRSADTAALDSFFMHELDAYYLSLKRKKVNALIATLAPDEMASLSVEALERLAQFSSEKAYFRFDGSTFAFQKKTWSPAALKKLLEGALLGSLSKTIESLEFNRQELVLVRFQQQLRGRAPRFGARAAKWGAAAILAANVATALWVDPLWSLSLVGASGAGGLLLWGKWRNDPERLVQERARLLRRATALEKMAFDEGLSIASRKIDLQVMREGEDLMLGGLKAQGFGELVEKGQAADLSADPYVILQLDAADILRAQQLSADEAPAGLSADDEAFLDFRPSMRAGSLWVYERGEKELIEGHPAEATLLSRGEQVAYISSFELDRLSERGLWVHVPEFSASHFYLVTPEKAAAFPQSVDIEIWERPYADQRRRLVAIAARTGRENLWTWEDLHSLVPNVAPRVPRPLGLAVCEKLSALP